MRFCDEPQSKDFDDSLERKMSQLSISYGCFISQGPQGKIVVVDSRPLTGGNGPAQGHQCKNLLTQRQMEGEQGEGTCYFLQYMII